MLILIINNIFFIEIIHKFNLLKDHLKTNLVEISKRRNNKLKNNKLNNHFNICSVLNAKCCKAIQ